MLSMAFYLGGKITLARITFPPRRLPNMSSNVKKYIGLDVHKESHRNRDIE